MSEDDGKTQASCWQCGSLGRYDNPQDAANAELAHQQSKHPVKLSVQAQAKANKGGSAGSVQRYTVRGKPKKPKK